MTRGAHIVAAALDVIATQGIHGTSLRMVAAAAGVSLAQVQYYFRSKDELIRAGYAAVGEQYLAAVENLHDVRETVWRWLPLDEEREKWARVWLAYAATSVTNAELAQESATANAELRAWLAARLGGDETTAAQLLALVDGYTLQALCLPIEERTELAERTLGAFLATHSPS